MYKRQLELHVKADGLKGLPLRLEIGIPAGTTIENEHFYMKAEAGSGMILRNGYLQVKETDRELVMGPGFGSHEFKGHYSGEEVNTSGLTVYCNCLLYTSKLLPSAYSDSGEWQMDICQLALF